MGRRKLPRKRMLLLLREGKTPDEVAKICGCHRRTVERAAAEVRENDPTAGLILAQPVTAAGVGGLHERWEQIAQAAMSRIGAELEKGRPGNAFAYTAGVATQRALECQRYLDQHKGLPADLPVDGKERAEALQQIAYRRAKSGSSTGLDAAIAAANRDTKVEIVFGDEGGDASNDRAAATAAESDPS